MICRRTIYKKFRKWFEPCFNDPLRLNEEQFIVLLKEMFGDEQYNHQDGIDVLNKLGFQERRNIKGTFYIRPTLEFYLDAEKKGVSLNRFLFLYWKRN